MKKINIGKCIVRGCNRHQRTKHLCDKHYQRFRKWGNFNIVKKSRMGGRDIKGNKNPNWKEGIAEYKNHALMKKLRLKKLKQQNYKCEICGGKATQIHHKNKNKSDQRLKNYIALCQKCHFSNFHKTPKTTSKYKRLLSISVKQFAELNDISINKIYTVKIN